jgi:AraC-like DNA-binding protein
LPPRSPLDRFIARLQVLCPRPGGRHLRRTFQATVGVGPKTYARIARFQRAVALGRSRPGRWSEVARAAGYFDQAHLTADFRELARVAPGALESDVPRSRATPADAPSSTVYRCGGRRDRPREAPASASRAQLDRRLLPEQQLRSRQELGQEGLGALFGQIAG